MTLLVEVLEVLVEVLERLGPWEAEVMQAVHIVLLVESLLYWE